MFLFQFLQNISIPKIYHFFYFLAGPPMVFSSAFLFAFFA
jgi:hypothetical protein